MKPIKSWSYQVNEVTLQVAVLQPDLVRIDFGGTLKGDPFSNYTHLELEEFLRDVTREGDKKIESIELHFEKLSIHKSKKGYFLRMLRELIKEREKAIVFYGSENDYALRQITLFKIFEKNRDLHRLHPEIKVLEYREVTA